MRNLELLQSYTVRGLSELEGCIGMVGVSVDYDTGRVYIATKETNITCLDPGKQEIVWTISLVEYGYAVAHEDSIIAIQHLPDQQSVCVATIRGDVLLYNTLSCELECVGSVESGLTNMRWSPDQELLILSTGADTLILMTKDFDAVAETTLHPQEFGEQKPMTVGWGKKETQFHGTAGKGAAVRKCSEDVKQRTTWDDMKIRISWRGDGQFFAVSAVGPHTGVRNLRIWSRECILQYTSEDLNGLEQALAWKPSGSLIASSQRKENGHQVIFFEKNGLRHGEFTLPFSTMAVQVREIVWNNESTIMAVWLEDLQLQPDDAEKPVCSYIHLWTVGNYHWYLKQCLEFQEAEKVVAMQWDPEHAYRLHVISQTGKYLQYTWSWTTHHSTGIDSNDDACVGVIDGDKILMTPFRKMIVPPPMAAYIIQLPKPVSQICFAPPPHSNNMAVLMNDGRIAWYKYSEEITCGDATAQLAAAGGNGFKAMITPLSLEAVLCVQDESGNPLVQEYPLQYHHLLWSSNQTLTVTSLKQDGVGTTLYYLSLSEDHPEMPKLCVRLRKTIFGQVYQMCYNPASGTLALQLTDGCVVTPDNETIVQLPQPCTEMALCTMSGQEVVLGLTERYRFYVNDAELAANCTSFVVHDEYLLLSTHGHTLCAVSLESDPKDLTSSKMLSFDENIRRVERGSRIVVAVSGDTKLILQMPRGNLETIHPRALVLSTIKKFLKALEYQQAYICMKRHRIDWNLLYDHDPKSFLENIDLLVRKLDSATSLNLFLAALKEDDTTQTLYSAAYQRTPDKNKMAGESKIDVVCDAIKESLDRINPEKFLLSILTAHAKKTTPELELCLQRIQQLSKLGPDPVSERPSLDEALKYLILLVDVNELYNVALGTYDFKLVLMVAEKSQKDPKEYLAFLNQLRKLETNYQRYTIDKQLQHYHKALHHISRCPEEERFMECLNLVTEHKLYSQALELFDKGSDRYKSIAIEYGAYLQTKNMWSEAALVYSLCDQWEMALEMHCKCGQWQQALCVAMRLTYSSHQLALLARDLSGYLSSHRQYSEAASLLMEYANDVEEAVSILISGCQWNEALRLIYKHKREDIIETNLRPALVETCRNTLTSLETISTTFDRHKKRFKIVQETRLQQGDAEVNDVDADLYSDTSSITGSVTSFTSASSSRTISSINSKVSGRSRKNRRKAEQKKRSLKEGSKHEDLALLGEMTEIIKNMDQLKGDVGDLLPILVMFDYTEDASELQQSLQGVLKVLQVGATEIWSSNPVQAMGGVEGSTSKSIAALLITQGPSSLLHSPSPDDLALFVPPKLSKDKWKLHMLEPR